jgi:hypothetical protein
MARRAGKSSPTPAQVAEGYRLLRDKMRLSVVLLALGLAYLALTRGHALLFAGIAAAYLAWALFALHMVRRALEHGLRELQRFPDARL